MLVVVAILAVLAVVLLPHITGGKTVDGKIIKSPMTATKDTVCRANIRSVRQSIEAMKAGDTDGAGVQSLDQIRELGPDLRRCAVGREAYVFDPQSGIVSCPHPGHESY